MQRNGPLLGSQVQTLKEILTIDAQLKRLLVELSRTYHQSKLKSINPVDLKAERKNTMQSLERLYVKRKALLKAHAQNAKRGWTERGDFSNVLHTGVILNGH